MYNAHALAAGRRMVDTALFAQLDDDDELLPAALALRAERMRQTDCPDAVVTNGIIRQDLTDTASIPDVGEVERKPLQALMDRNWLLPGATMFRTAAVTAEVFVAMPRYLEWTYMALVLVLRHRIAFLPEAAIVHHVGHAFSVNDSRECVLGRPRAFDPLLAIGLPAAVRRRLKMKRSATWHAAADLHRACGNWRTIVGGGVAQSGQPWLSQLSGHLGTGGCSIRRDPNQNRLPECVRPAAGLRRYRGIRRQRDLHRRRSGACGHA